VAVDFLAWLSSSFGVFICSSCWRRWCGFLILLLFTALLRGFFGALLRAVSYVALNGSLSACSTHYYRNSVGSPCASHLSVRGLHASSHAVCPPLFLYHALMHTVLPSISSRIALLRPNSTMSGVLRPSRRGLPLASQHSRL
jgi:hypothetical protein